MARLDPPLMSDAEMAEFLAPGDARGAELVARLTSAERALFDRMAFVADEINAGRIPAGVII